MKISTTEKDNRWKIYIGCKTNVYRKEERKRGRRESSPKEEVCRFSNCDETGHRCFAQVSYDDRTTDDGAVPSMDIHPSIYPSIGTNWRVLAWRNYTYVRKIDKQSNIYSTVYRTKYI